MAASPGSLWRASLALRWRLAQPSVSRAMKFRSQYPRHNTARAYATLSEILSRRDSDSLPPQMRAQTVKAEAAPESNEEKSSQPEPDPEAGAFGRNDLFRAIFKSNNGETQSLVAKKMRTSPFVPDVRTYSSELSNKVSEMKAIRAARVQVAQDRIWEHHGKKTPSLKEIMSIMKQMSGRKEEGRQLEAMRVLLPDKVDFTLPSRKLEYVESATGVLAKLGVSVDHPNPERGIILRGPGRLLARAADELIMYNKDIKVFRLGKVTTFDYDTRQLWPSLEFDEEPKGPSIIRKSGLESPDSIWMHREADAETITYPYEETPKPATWTKKSFHKYITMLIQKRLKGGVQIRFYDRATDTDGVRIKLIMEAFEDPALRHCISPTTLNAALSFMMWRGGHRATAEKLFRLAQEWGVPIDTTTFNIMLGGYVTIGSTAHFVKVLRQMRDGFFAPNSRTWLHVLKLAEKDEAKRSIIVNMYDHGAFRDPAARREIAKIMAPHDFHISLRTSQTLNQFLRDQAERYGEDWFTTGALVHLVDEFLLFHDSPHGLNYAKFQELKILFEKPPSDGVIAYGKPIAAILNAAVRRKNWDMALWALELHERLGCTPDKDLYTKLVDLAVESQAPHALGALLVHGTVLDRFSWPTRRKLQRCLLGTYRHPFWRLIRLKCFNSDMTRYLREHSWTSNEHPIEVVESAIRSAVGGPHAQPCDSLCQLLKREYREHDVPWRKEWEKRGVTDMEDRGSWPELTPLRMEFKLHVKMQRWAETRPGDEDMDEWDD